MPEELVRFAAVDGAVLSGIMRLPAGTGRHPGIVQGPGWLGLKDARLYERYHAAFLAAGWAVLVFDYRGFGDSQGDPTQLSPERQLQDLHSAVDYLAGRHDIDDARIGVFGSGGTGGGNAVRLLATSERVQWGIAQVPVADGADWLRRMRATETEWKEFLDWLARDRVRRTSGPGEMVNPAGDIVIPTAERRATSVKKDVDSRVPKQVSLSAADELLSYRPIDDAGAARGLMVVAVDGDLVTPTDHALALYNAAAPPKRLVMQYGTTHYAAYQAYGHLVIPRMVDWIRRRLDQPTNASAAGTIQP